MKEQVKERLSRFDPTAHDRVLHEQQKRRQRETIICATVLAVVGLVVDVGAILIAHHGPGAIFVGVTAWLGQVGALSLTIIDERRRDS